MRCVVAKLFFAERSHALCHCEIYLRSDFTLYVVARLFCVAVSRVVSLRDFSCGASHTLCCCEIFCGAVSHIVLLRDLFAKRFHVVCCCEAFLA